VHKKFKAGLEFSAGTASLRLTWFFLRAMTMFVMRPNGRPSCITSPSVASAGIPRICRTRLALLPSIFGWMHHTNICGK